MLRLLFFSLVLSLAFHPMTSEASPKKAQARKQKPSSTSQTKAIEQAIKELSPVTIEDVDNNEKFELTADGQSTVPTDPVFSKAKWHVVGQQLIIKSLDGRKYQFSVELKGGSLRINGDGSTEEDKHHFMVNVPD